MRFIGFRGCAVVAGVAATAAVGGSSEALAADSVTANGCPHHQAFVEGDDAAVAEWLPDQYEPVRTASGAPLLFVRAIRCDELGLGEQTGPGIISTYGVVIESPDELGCASASPFGPMNGENPPICNWYVLGWLSDNRAVIKWVRDGTRDVPAAYVSDLEFELGEFDAAQGGAPFRFETPPTAPSPFTIEAIGREHDGELPVRGGYWFDTPAGTVKFVISTNDLTSGDASGVVKAVPGSLLATLMGATERSYAAGYSSFSAERWQHASYRKQRLWPTHGADKFDGSCSFQGTVRFTPPATNTKSQDLVYDWDGEGTCSGTLNGREISEAPAKAHQAGSAHATCGEAKTIAPGTGAITFSSGETIRSTLEFLSHETEVDLMYFGERSGFARGDATFLTDRTSPEVLLQCGSEEGVEETPLDVSLSTESPLVSEPSKAQLDVTVVPKKVQRGERRRFRFRVLTADGEPVKRALVRFAGRRARTGRAGRARLDVKLKRAGRHRARVSKHGFVAARVIVLAWRP